MDEGCGMIKVALLASALMWASTGTAGATTSPAAGVCGQAAATEGSQQPSAAAVMRLATDWVAAINSADDAAYLRFVEERGPALGAGMEPLAFRDFLRGMTLCGIKSAKADD